MSRALEHDVVYRDVKPEIILSAAWLVVIGDRRRSRANRLTLGLGAIKGAAHLIARLPCGRPHVMLTARLRPTG